MLIYQRWTARSDKMEIMNITRVRKALQRNSHLSTAQLCIQYPEFIQLCAEIEFEEELSTVCDCVRARINQILRQ